VSGLRRRLDTKLADSALVEKLQRTLDPYVFALLPIISCHGSFVVLLFTHQLSPVAVTALSPPDACIFVRYV
jgi:hypothetical protein